MADYKLSAEAKKDLIRIHQYGVERFGLIEADNYFFSFFECFNTIAERPYSYEAVDYIKQGYRRCVRGSDSVYFRISNGVVEIMAIIGMQDLNSKL